MRYVPTPTACKLTGLSTEKLREWTIRRALVPADVRPKGKGSPAGFSWQTILVLRVTVVLRELFNVELEAHKSSLALLREMLNRRSFLSLWGARLVFSPSEAWKIVEPDAELDGDVLIVSLDSHLVILRDGFVLPDLNGGQLDLFTLPAVHGPRELASGPVKSGRRKGDAISPSILFGLTRRRSNRGAQ